MLHELRQVEYHVSELSKYHTIPLQTYLIIVADAAKMTNIMYDCKCLIFTQTIARGAGDLSVGASEYNL